MKIVFIRAAQFVDFEKGHLQSHQAADRLSQIFSKCDLAFVSPNPRAMETVKILYDDIPSRAPIVTDFLAPRRGPGCEAERPSRSELEFSYPGFDYAIPEEVGSYDVPESDEALRARMEFILDLAHRMDGENVLIVSHHDVIRAYTNQNLSHGELYEVDTQRS